MENGRASAFFREIDDHFSSTGVENDELSRFVRKLFRLTPVDELSDEPVADLCGYISSLRYFLNDFDGAQPKIRSFNPNLNEDGWEHSSTQIFILQKDMAFLVDSVRMSLERLGLGIERLNSTIFDVERNEKGDLIAWLDAPTDNSEKEALISFQVDHYVSEAQHQKVLTEISGVLDAVSVVNSDYHPCVAMLDQVIEQISNRITGRKDPSFQESLNFLSWLRNNHFTFLAYGYYQLSGTKGAGLSLDPEKSLGLFRHEVKGHVPAEISELSQGIQEFHQKDAVLTLSKSTMRSQVHRDTYCDYVIVKAYGDDGEVVGEHRFQGLYTSMVYSQSAFEIPMVSPKLHRIFERTGLNPQGHYGKSLRQVIETHPREELFHGSEDQLYDILLGIWQINERRRVRLFVRKDPFEKFVNCIVYFPRDSYRTEVREKTQKLLMEVLAATECQFYTFFTQSLLVRTHFVIRTVEGHHRELEVSDLEKQIAGFANDWRDDLHRAMVEHWGDEKGIDLSLAYRNAFPVSYQSHFEARAAVQDVALCHGLHGNNAIATQFFVPQGAEPGIMRLKIFHSETELSLSRMVPMLENLGFQVIGEHPYCLRPEGRKQVWLHDFTLKFSLDIQIDVPGVRKNFIDALTAVWHGHTDDDRFNWLIIGARLDWRSVALVRLYARYMKQLGISISQDFISSTLAQNLDITRNLVALFKNCFDPKRVGTEGDESDRSERSRRLENKVLDALSNVKNLNQDQVLRNYLHLICATLRTNFFQRDSNGKFKNYISIKLSPRELAIAPNPKPAYEIFVYSPQFEGVHLRSDKVARGGIRWSDRHEDYRTEILGLMKSQQVKNAVIVPAGAKGGFVVKKLPLGGSRSEVQAEGQACYQRFMGALLDITDNIIDGQVSPPKEVIRRDTDDTYLVVAADKGTASFSDLANGVSSNYHHWLGDAFASGGSNGYDHKKMGITARGAWVAVQRHFREKGTDIQNEPFSVVGIGDMSGDVFGNGMLLSPCIRLVAAFNHKSVFIDPDPNISTSFAERQRLFDSAQGWEEYNPELISSGGGVYSRELKSIKLSEQARTAFGISEEELTPAQLINKLLKAQVDLLWNGGIGTYVKASSESHSDAGDRTNDEVRVNGKELRCQVFGEGGNLGMTQRGRVEFCLNGGACNTDFIDNSAGVDCSDLEVNTKIALNQLVAAEDLTMKQRNHFLEEMTEDVATKVLRHNYRQTQAISLSMHRSQTNPSEYWQCILDWEADGFLNRGLEFLPDDDILKERQKDKKFLTRPEISVLLSYSKILFKQGLLGTPISSDNYIHKEAYKALPARLAQTYPQVIDNHILHHEVLCNQLANEIVDIMGLPYVHRQMKSTGASPDEVARAYIMTRDLFSFMDVWQEVEALDHRVPTETQAAMQLSLMRLGRRSSRWLLRNRRSCRDTGREIEQLKPILQTLLDANTGEEDSVNAMEPEIPGLDEIQISDHARLLIDSASDLYFALGMADVCLRTESDLENVSEAYRLLGEVLQLELFTAQIIALKSANRWEDFARESHMDDLENQFRSLVIRLLESRDETMSLDELINQWEVDHESQIARWLEIVGEIHNSSEKNYAMVSVALRELNSLVEHN